MSNYWPDGPTETRTTYEANCHCGLVRYSVTLDESLDTQSVNNCNCSICVHNGYFLVYPKKEDVVFHSGYDQLKSYRFANKVVRHLFCPDCGSSLLIDFKEMTEPRIQGRLAINVRHFRNIDVAKLIIRQSNNGAERPPLYDSWIDRDKSTTE